MSRQEKRRENLILAFDTSTLRGSVAIGWNEPIAAKDFLTEKGHAGWLLPHINGVMRGAGFEKKSIKALAVGAGPGNFTGVKVAVSTAKALSYAFRVPLIGISSLDVLACSSTAESDFTVALLDARRGMMYCAFYIFAEEYLRISEYMLLAPEDIYARLTDIIEGRVHFIGDKAKAIAEGLPPMPGVEKSWEYGFPDARALLKISLNVLEKGESGNSFDVLPIYLKKPV